MSGEDTEERMALTPSVALTVSYDGFGFAGFARQPGLRTVQGALEEALSVALRRTVEVVGAGRTDSGVHALGQVVSFASAEAGTDLRVLSRSVNALAGEGVTVTGARLARPGFSARFDATAREYRYRIATGPARPLFLHDFAWHVPSRLDRDAMNAATALLVGEHDFRSFCVTESAEGQRTHRYVRLLEVYEAEELGERCLTVRVVGNAFLHSMVRVIVGTLVEVGAGRWSPQRVGDALAACDRRAAGPTAPAKGLVLHSVEYPEDVWIEQGVVPEDD